MRARLSVELVPGSSAAAKDSPAFFDPVRHLAHPKQKKVKNILEDKGLHVDLNSTLQDGIVYSDAYVHCEPQDLDIVVKVLHKVGYPADLVDVYGNLSETEKEAVEHLAEKEGWQLEKWDG